MRGCSETAERVTRSTGWFLVSILRFCFDERQELSLLALRDVTGLGLNPKRRLIPDTSALSRGHEPCTLCSSVGIYCSKEPLVI